MHVGSIQCVLHPEVLLGNNIEAGCFIILKEVHVQNTL